LIHSLDVSDRQNVAAFFPSRVATRPR